MKSPDPFHRPPPDFVKMPVCCHAVRKDLAGCLEKALARSGQLTPDVLDYIETTLFPVHSDPLTLFLNSDDNARDSLLSLIFSPDESLRTDIESLVMAAPCMPDHEAALKRHLIEGDFHIPVTLPEAGVITCLKLPDDIISRYVDQLRLSWQMPDKVDQAIRRTLSSAAAPAARVRIRNAGLLFTPFRQVALSRFFERIPDSDSEFSELLDEMLFVLSLLDETENGGPTLTSLYDRLMQIGRMLLLQLQQNRRTEQLLRRSTMETLMSQGIRGVSIGTDSLLARMHRINRLCTAMTGRMLPQDLPMETPIREVSDITAMAPCSANKMPFFRCG